MRGKKRKKNEAPLTKYCVQSAAGDDFSIVLSESATVSDAQRAIADKTGFLACLQQLFVKADEDGPLREGQLLSEAAAGCRELFLILAPLKWARMGKDMVNFRVRCYFA